jgi:alkaline phosphatase D
LQGASSLVGAALTTSIASKLVVGKPRFGAYPFTLGVASGDPVADGFVLWTRLARQPLEGGGMLREIIPVLWEVARDERFRQTVKHGEALAVPELGHSAHVEVSGELLKYRKGLHIAGG